MGSWTALRGAAWLPRTCFWVSRGVGLWSHLLRTSGAPAGNGISESDSGRRAESKAGLDTERCMYSAGLSGVRAEKHLRKAW